MPQKNIFRVIFKNLKKIATNFMSGIFPPGFHGASLYEILSLFFSYARKPIFNLYAGALSFNFFLALFPAIIFLFTLVAYIPIPNLKEGILETLDFFLPQSSFSTINDSITDIVKNQRSGLLSVGFISALYFASNGVHNMMSAFDSSLETEIKKKRNFLQKRITSIFITLLVTLLLLLSIVVLIIGGYISANLSKWGMNESLVNAGLFIIETLTLTSLVFYTISFIYHYAPSSISKWRLISPGSIVATTLSLISTYAFTSYVNHFNLYNKVYGSIGAIIAMMLLIYVNVYSILIGFELNHSINKVADEKSKHIKKRNTFEN